MNLFAQVPSNKSTKALFTLELVLIEHLSLLHREPAVQLRNRHRIAFREQTPQGGVPRVHLDLNSVRICCCQSGWVSSGPIIMEMDPFARFAELGVGVRPLACGCEVEF